MVQLHAGPLQVLLAPALGGSIARFDLVEQTQKIPILRGAEGWPSSVLEAASFPLVPFCNRVRGGRFSFRGREVTLARNMEGDASPLHGQGWLAPWTVKSQAAREAELSYLHEAGEWPWRYEARQQFKLDEDRLSIRLACRNLSDEPMPCGLGQHPYLPCTADTRLDTRVATAWTIDENVLPVAEVPASGRFDLRNRLVCGQDLDHGFGGWGGMARIGDPSLPFAIELSSPDAGYFQLYSPTSGGLFVAEPVTHANAALNEPEEEWARLGMTVLEPGGELALDMRIALVSINASSR